jgi:hypothetical protein
MNRRNVSISLLLFVLLVTNSCVSVIESQKKEYGLLESAVTYSAEKVIGEYGDTMPNDFTSEMFLLLVHDKIPSEYYDTLLRYRLEIRPKGSYYLLLVFDPGNNALILFDYSCTSEVDGPILLEPSKYNAENLELFDQCKEPPQ